MSDYKKIKEITNARLFLRNYIYDEETLPIFEALLNNRFKIESIVYDNAAKMYVITNADSGITHHTTEQDFGLCCGVPVLKAFCEFLCHPGVINKINKCDFAIDIDTKLLLQNLRYDNITAGALVDITGISSSDKNGVFSFIIKL